MGWLPTGADADAIHDNISGEINAVTEKTTPVAADLVLIEDSAASFAKKKVQVGNLPGGTGGGAVPEWITYFAERVTSETSHAADDFFDDDDHTAWTLTQVTGTTTVTEKYGVLSLRDVGTSAGDLNTKSKAFSLSAPVTIETAVRWLGPPGAGGEGGVALGMTDGTAGSSNWAGIALFSSLTSTYFTAGTLTTFDSTATGYYQRGTWMQTSHLYLRFCWKATNTFRIAMSPDGVSWQDMSGSDISRTITPTRFALGVTAYNSGFPTVAGFEYFRVAEADLIT